MLTTAVAAPVMIVCCGGGLAFVGSAATGLIAHLSGSGVVLSVLTAAIAGFLAYFLLPALLAFVLLTLYALVRNDRRQRNEGNRNV